MANPLIRKQVEDYYSANRYLADYLAQENIVPNANGFISCDGHRDRTPSLSVDLNTDKWYCFGCGNGGGFIAYYALHNQISYDKAIDILALKLGFVGGRDNLILTDIEPKKQPKRIEGYKSRKVLIAKLKRKNVLDDIINFLCTIQDSDNDTEVRDFTTIDEKVELSALEDFSLEDFL